MTKRLLQDGYQGSGWQPRIATGGGTFDTLHAGHKEYIRTVFEYGTRVLLYVTSDEHANAKKLYEVRPYHIRVKRLETFIRKLGIGQDRYKIRKLNTLSQIKKELYSEDIHIAIVVPEYYTLLRHVNKKRLENGKKSILILVKERTRDHHNNDISSTVLHLQN